MGWRGRGVGVERTPTSLADFRMTSEWCGMVLAGVAGHQKTGWRVGGEGGRGSSRLIMNKWRKCLVSAVCVSMNCMVFLREWRGAGTCISMIPELTWLILNGAGDGN